MTTKVSHGLNGRISFFCPGCGDAHQIQVPTWTWNGSEEAPTFSPSVLGKFYGLTRTADGPDKISGPKEQTCHSFVTDGKIQYLSDSTHHLAGQTVDLPEWPYD